MQRVLANVFAAVSMSLLLTAVTTGAVSAAANPDNRGHHYGQLKHRPTPVQTAGHPPQQAIDQPPANPSLRVRLPVVKLAPAVQTAATINAVSRRAAVDPWWWLALLLVPALLAIWVLAARRLALAAAPAAKPEPVPSPA